MFSLNRKLFIQAAILPLFALLALGSSKPKKSGDSSPGTSADNVGTTTTTGASDKKVQGNCYDAKRGACTETYNPYGVDSEKKLCESMGGNWVASAECPRKDTLWGVCTQMDPFTPTDVYEKIYYYNEGANKGAGGPTAKDACDALTGKWEPGAASAKAPSGGKTGSAKPKKK
jgi:hypothetical protein